MKSLKNNNKNFQNDQLYNCFSDLEFIYFEKYTVQIDIKYKTITYKKYNLKL